MAIFRVARVFDPEFINNLPDGALGEHVEELKEIKYFRTAEGDLRNA